MSLGIGKEHETLPLQITLGLNEVLRVTADGKFVWHPEADRMIEEGNFSHSPAMPYILKALRKRDWVGLTDEEREEIALEVSIDAVSITEAKLKEKNT